MRAEESTITRNGGKETERISSGIQGLDDIMQGGFPKNHLYLVEGYPGSGKTTLALQFLLEGLKHGEKGLYVTFSETKTELCCAARSHGWNTEGLHIMELDIEQMRDPQDDRYTVFRPADVELGETTQRIYKQVDELKPSRVIFDSLSEMRLLARDPLRYRREILGLKQFFRGRECTILLIDDRSDPHQDGQLQSIAHGVLSLETQDTDYGVIRRRMRVAKLRGSKYREGVHDFAILTGGIQVYPRHHMTAKITPTSGDVIKSGIPELDALLGGGMDRGTNSLVLGPAGSGKSTLITQYVFGALQRGEAVAGYLFEESETTFLERAQGMGLNVKPYLEKGLLHLEHSDPAELSPGEFAFRVREHVEKYNARLVFIDSLNGYMNALPNERYLLIQMHELVRFLNSRDVISFLIMAQTGLVGPTQNPIDVSYLADTVIMMRFFEAQGEVRQTIAVVKRRRGAHEHTLREFKITSKGLVIGEPLKDFQGVLTGAPIYRGAVAPIPHTTK